MHTSPSSSLTASAQTGARPERISWLPPLVFCINIAGLGLSVAYSRLNLWPDLSTLPGHGQRVLLYWAVLISVLAPTAASLMHVWPVLRWLRNGRRGKPGDIPAPIARRAAGVPLALATYALLGWMLVAAAVVMRLTLMVADTPFGLAVHLVLRPLLGGLLVATATFFVAEYICRVHVWPALLAHTRIAGNTHLRRVRVWHRLLVFWLTVSVLPLGAVALTTYARVAGMNTAADVLLGRIVAVVLLIAISAAVCGAVLAWLVSRSIAHPLESLELAMAKLRDGDFDTRETVSSTDEIGALTEGFNLMAARLSRSYADLATRNRELANALDQVNFLEHVKRGLDRFVPEAVSRAIEANPDDPGLAKQARDVTVLFLDIEGYTRLSEDLPRPALNALVEQYFSLFMAPIRAGGGDISETAGDGLMIIFQASEPQAHAAAAVRAALAIEELAFIANRDAGARHPPIHIHIGIASGECDVGATRLHGPAGERWTFTASGPVTNIAARICDQARGGQILLNAETERRVREIFNIASLGPATLKNISLPVEIWEVQSAH
jgi:class 3 adenylate cyclase/HAMP domain-containing protein